MASSTPSCFLAPLPRSRSPPSSPPRTTTPILPPHRPIHPIGRSSPSLLRPSSLDPSDAPIGSAPLFVLAAAILFLSAQSWINSLLGGDRGLGAFLSDGSGYNKSGFKPRRRPIADERSTPGDPSKPLGGPDPLPWLKLPQFDYVDVAGQPRRPKLVEGMPPPPTTTGRDETEVLFRLESLRRRMKDEVERGNLAAAKGIEDELKRVMEEEGFDYSS